MSTDLRPQFLQAISEGSGNAFNCRSDYNLGPSWIAERGNEMAISNTCAKIGRPLVPNRKLNQIRVLPMPLVPSKHGSCNLMVRTLFIYRPMPVFVEIKHAVALGREDRHRLRIRVLLEHRFKRDRTIPGEIHIAQRDAHCLGDVVEVAFVGQGRTAAQGRSMQKVASSGCIVSEPTRCKDNTTARVDRPATARGRDRDACDPALATNDHVLNSVIGQDAYTQPDARTCQLLDHRGARTGLAVGRDRGERTAKPRRVLRQNRAVIWE